MNISNAGTDVSFTHICIIQVVYLDVLEKVRVSLDLKYYRYTSEFFFCVLAGKQSLLWSNQTITMYITFS